MTIDQLKAEARSKPSGVAFRKLSPQVSVSVKYTRYFNTLTLSEREFYQWKCSGEEISETRASELLQKVSH